MYVLEKTWMKTPRTGPGSMLTLNNNVLSQDTHSKIDQYSLPAAREASEIETCPCPLFCLTPKCGYKGEWNGMGNAGSEEIVPMKQGLLSLLIGKTTEAQRDHVTFPRSRS